MLFCNMSLSFHAICSRHAARNFTKQRTFLVYLTYTNLSRATIRRGMQRDISRHMRTFSAKLNIKFGPGVFSPARLGPRQLLHVFYSLRFLFRLLRLSRRIDCLILSVLWLIATQRKNPTWNYFFGDLPH